MQIEENIGRIEFIIIAFVSEFMVDISERQQRKGAIWGALAFGAGVAVAWWLVNPNSDPSRLKRAIWIYLSSHYVAIGPVKVASVLNSLPRLGIVARGGRSELWHAIPVLITGIAAAGTNIALGRTNDPNLMLQNSALILVGYLPTALIAAVWSGAAGAAGWLLVIIAVAFLALAVGSQAVSRSTKGTPVLAITNLGGLVGIGLIVLLGGWFVIRLLIPIATLSLGGVALGTAVVYVARTYT